MVLLAFHGKLGSGKNEAARQTKLLFANGSEFEEKALASNLKAFTAVLTRTTLQDQYSEEGKNIEIPVCELSIRSILLDVQGLLNFMNSFDFFQCKPSEQRIHKIIGEIVASHENKGHKTDVLSLSCGSIQQEVGTRFRQAFGEDVWISLLLDDWEPRKNWLITDLRFPNEKAEIEALGGFCIKLVGDPKQVRANSKRDTNHISETALDAVTKWDCVVDNQHDDIQNLRKQLFKFARKNMYVIGQSFVLLY
jgi:hypothetical protein